MAMFVCLIFVALVCGLKAVRAAHLFHATLWLAGVSIATTLMLYLVEAYTIAVIELSLSVGLITILLVFAISMVGADSPDTPASGRLNMPLLAATLLLVLGLSMPFLSPHPDTVAIGTPSFAEVFWQQRESDVLAQVAMIFAGAMGVLGLLTEARDMKTGRDQSVTHQQSDVSRRSRHKAELDQV